MFCVKQKTAYEMRISDWSSDVCSSDLDNHDGIHFFPIEGRSTEGRLVMNHEYTTAKKGAYTWLFGPNGTEPWTADKARKAMNAHGVSVIHIERNKAGKWAIVPDQRYNRRITRSAERRVGTE